MTCCVKGCMEIGGLAVFTAAVNVAAQALWYNVSSIAQIFGENCPNNTFVGYNSNITDACASLTKAYGGSLFGTFACTVTFCIGIGAVNSTIARVCKQIDTSENTPLIQRRRA